MSTIFSSLWSRPVTSVPYLKGGTPSLLDGTSNILVWPRLWIWDESFREEEGGVRRIREKEEQVNYFISSLNLSLVQPGAYIWLTHWIHTRTHWPLAHDIINAPRNRPMAQLI